MSCGTGKNSVAVVDFTGEWNIVKSERDYYGLNYVNITPMQDEAWNALIDFRVTDLLACGMAVVVAVILFFLLQNQAEGMIFTTGDVVAKGSHINDLPFVLVPSVF